jgi:cold shock CspA family protein
MAMVVVGVGGPTSAVPPEADVFHGLTPARLVDTRSSGATVDGLFRGGGRLTAGGTVTVKVTGRGGVPASGVGAVALNVTAVNPSAASFLTVYPTGAARPNTSNVTLAAGRTLPNMVIATVGTGGQITIYNDQGTTHAIVDVLGWFPTPAVAASTTRVSVATGGGQGNGASDRASISGDGRYVAFTSNATNLVPGDTNGLLDVFVHDRQTGTTTRVSVASDGTQANSDSFGPSISGDGRHVAFISSATNLVPGDTNGLIDVFVHDRQTGTTTRVSVASNGTQANSNSFGPSISSDGRYVAFSSFADTLVAGDTNTTSDVFVHDRQTGTTTRVSVATGGGQSSSGSDRPSISGDGRFVAFASQATNLVSGDTNGASDVFVHDRQTGATSRVSVATGGAQANGASDRLSISGDGRFVAFASQATNLVSGDTNGASDVFVHDRQSTTTTRVSVATDGTQANEGSTRPSISANGRYVAYQSFASNLVVGDTNGRTDVFLRDRDTATTSRVSIATNGTQGNEDSIGAAISGNGRYIVFETAATNLVVGDTNGVGDVVVHDQGSQ